MNEYPKNLFRDGSAFEWEGRKYDGLIVHSKEEEAEAVKAGWRANPFAEKAGRRK